VTKTIAPASSLGITLSIFAVIVGAFSACSLLASQGRNFEGRGPWELTMTACFLMAAALAFLCYRIALSRGPAFGIVDGRIEHYGWKDTIPADHVVAVIHQPGNMLLRRRARLALLLTDGCTREVSPFLLRGSSSEIADAIRVALKLEEVSAPLS
jgi:hypothetical protein